MISPLKCYCTAQLAHGKRGWHGIECLPPGYRWAGDRLAGEFGADAVRVSHVADYGWSQSIGVQCGERWYGAPLQRAPFHTTDAPICLNETPELLDRLIERARAATRGFGT